MAVARHHVAAFSHELSFSNDVRHAAQPRDLHGHYVRLGAAHEAVVEWCRTHDHRVSGTRWEVYGHWTDDPAKLRTDVYYLLV